MHTGLGRTPVIPIALIILWFFAWISTPESSAVKSAVDVEGYAHVKIALRVLIGSLAFLLLIRFVLGSVALRSKALYTLRLPLFYVVWNIVLLSRSEEFFYSIYRIAEFVSIWLTGFLFVEIKVGDRDIPLRIQLFFNILTLVCLTLLIVYFAAPEWGRKVAGIDSTTGEMTTRLGGSVLRVDLAAMLGGCVLLFWLFTQAEGLGFFAKWCGICAGAGVTALAHSRSSILFTLGIIILSFFRKSTRPMALVLLASLLVISFVAMDAVVDFLTRGSELNTLSELNGRLLLWASLWQANDGFSLLIGNGYLMNSPEGLDFFVPEMAVYRDSPHNGYLSVLLGSGVVGSAIVVVMYASFWRRLDRGSVGRDLALNERVTFVFLFLSLLTFMDYGVWGVTSPGMLIFAVLYSAAMHQYRRPTLYGH